MIVGAFKVSVVAVVVMEVAVVVAAMEIPVVVTASVVIVGNAETERMGMPPRAPSSRVAIGGSEGRGGGSIGISMGGGS